MTATTATTEDPRGRASNAKDGTGIGAAPLRSATVASRAALYALLLRDLTVLRKHLIEFVLRTVIQPFLLVFVFLYVFPQIGQTVGGRPGIVGLRDGPGARGGRHLDLMFQGVQSVALQLSQEFGFTREIEDRVQAPCPVWLVAVAKILAGVFQGSAGGRDRLPLMRDPGRPRPGRACRVQHPLVDRVDAAAAFVRAWCSAPSG